MAILPSVICVLRNHKLRESWSIFYFKSVLFYNNNKAFAVLLGIIYLESVQVTLIQVNFILFFPPFLSKLCFQKLPTGFRNLYVMHNC